MSKKSTLKNVDAKTPTAGGGWKKIASMKMIFGFSLIIQVAIIFGFNMDAQTMMPIAALLSIVIGYVATER